MKGPYSVSGTGASITLSGSSASASIPTNKAGEKCRYVRLNTTTGAYVRWGVGAQTAVNTDMLVIEECVVCVNGADTIAGLQAATGGVLIVTPLENS